MTWLESELGLFNDASLIDLKEPNSQRQWFVLDGSASRRQYGNSGRDEPLERDTWYRINCIVVSQENQKEAIQSLGEKILTDPDAIPGYRLNASSYLGEYPWHLSTAVSDDWIAPDSGSAMSVEVRPATIRYSTDDREYDHSIDGLIKIVMPAPWLATAMGLKLKNGRNPIFVDSEGKTRFYDTSIDGHGFPAALVDRDKFLATLDSRGLSAIWIIAGEKRTNIGRMTFPKFTGCVQHTGIYAIEPNGLLGKVRPICRNSSMTGSEHLKEMLEGNIPEAIAARYKTSTSAS